MVEGQSCVEPQLIALSLSLNCRETLNTEAAKDKTAPGQRSLVNMLWCILFSAHHFAWLCAFLENYRLSGHPSQRCPTKSIVPLGGGEQHTGMCQVVSAPETHSVGKGGKLTWKAQLD